MTLDFGNQKMNKIHASVFSELIITTTKPSYIKKFLKLSISDNHYMMVIIL